MSAWDQQLKVLVVGGSPAPHELAATRIIPAFSKSGRANAKYASLTPDSTVQKLRCCQPSTWRSPQQLRPTRLLTTKKKSSV